MRNTQKLGSKGSFEAQKQQKTGRKLTKTGENRSETTPNARRRLKTLPPKSASEVPGDGEDQRYPETTLNKQQNSQNVKNPGKNRTKQRPASPERRARCCSGPPEMETQAAPHVGSSPEAPSRAIATLWKVPKRQVTKKVIGNFSKMGQRQFQPRTPLTSRPSTSFG